ncbi:uncharacterized protein FPRO_12165 [Fusarium proliferatum ET1]|uniref:Apple domain-containing protein n=1 Tax=Fusarium proliferatum (strain ET1) TaxID=1227346 RepID=A0A1L7W234_FUSPR|nr:uncharacterized protein FPRO_12165 [Fusarium proliferatum ET1]CZR46715.1 uncharacterized protein FPRO_12165 [Fusarium proliferatum ET1]
MPESWCVTYLSTYLVPISAVTSSPAENSLPGIEYSTSLDISVTLNPSSSLSFVPDVTLSVATTEIETAPPSSTTGPSTLNEQIVFRVVPDIPDNNRLRRRALGGFVGSPSEICDNANVFNLVDGQLLEGNVPIYFNGEDYKVFSGQRGPVPSGAITRTFFRDGDILRFRSSRIIPIGEAGFCQTPSDGLVYITFSSQPAGCIAVRLSAIGGVSTLLTESNPPVVTTESNGVGTTKNPITQPIPSSTFRWSNISSSFQPPPETSKSSFVPFSTFIFTSDSSTLVEVISSTEIVEPESSSAQERISTTDDFPASEIGTTTEEASTLESTINVTTEESTTIPTTQETTDTTTTEALTTKSTTQQTSDTTSQETTTEITTSEETTAETATEESTTENPTTTTFTSALDSTTETTTEAATTTTAASEDIVCPSNPQQCIRTFQIQCDTVIGGIPLTSGTSTLEQCSQACFNDPNCVIFTHSGTQCFSTTDSSNNQGSFALQGWVSGIRSTC